MDLILAVRDQMAEIKPSGSCGSEREIREAMKFDLYRVSVSDRSGGGPVTSPAMYILKVLHVFTVMSIALEV